MTLPLKKLMICLTGFFLFSCSSASRKVIWRDYRKNKTNETIKIGLAKDFYGKIHKVKLTANKTKSFSANQDDFIISQEAAADSFSYCFQYPVAFLMTCDLEVFLFDDFEITKTEDGYKLNPQDDVLAYYVNDFGYIVKSKTLNKPIWVTVHEL
ncbi:MAG: hypothetical protein II039_00520 [Treponema sp.]|nr:hypothetical protein [Treponema sp.]